MRVVIVSKACVVGAYQTKLEAIAAHDGIELTAVVPPSWRDGVHRHRLERAHTAGYRLLVTPILLNGRFHLHCYPALGRLLREIRPDVCHLDEEPYNLATYLAARQAKAVGARVLFFTWQNLLRRYPLPFALMERSVYRRSAAAIAGSRDAAEVLRAKGYSGPIEVIPQFGVDPEVYAPNPNPPGHGPFRVGFAGRLVEEKGLGVLTRAMVGLAGDWHLYLYGEGPLRPQLEGYFATRGMLRRVTFAGQVPSRKMPQALRALDALVLPSLTRRNWKEQFGRVLVEAMACGVPVVGSDSGEIPHVIGEAGLVVPEDDPIALRQALFRLQADLPLRRRLAELGRRRVLAHYTQEQIARQTVALYRSLAGEAAP